MEQLKIQIMMWRFRNPNISLLFNGIKDSLRPLISILLFTSITRIVFQLNKQGMLAAYCVFAISLIMYMYYLNLRLYNQLKDIAYRLPDVTNKLIEANIKDHEDWFKWAAMSAFDLWNKKQDMKWKYEHEYFDFILDVQVIVLSLFLIILCLEQLS